MRGSSRHIGLGAFNPPDELTIQSQLKRLYTHLRRRHPNLVGIGVGSRRRQGVICPETVVQFQVRKKGKQRGRTAQGEALLPDSVPIWTNVLGQVICVMIPTDVRQVERMRTTAFGVDGGQATALAIWTSAAGARCLGVITAGHCLPAKGQLVEVATRSDVTQARVVVKSDHRKDGVDVGLARLDCDPEDIADVAFEAAPPISVPDLVALLGTDRHDALKAPMRFWNEIVDTELVGLAYYWMFTANSGNGSFTLQDAVEIEAFEGTFQRGLSGSPLAVGLPNGEARIVALQAFANTSEQRCLGTYFPTAITWLRSAHRDLSALIPFWNTRDLR